MEHDFKAALREIDEFNGGRIPGIGDQYGGNTDPVLCDALLAALRLAVARQEQEEAVEREEAVRVRVGVRLMRPGNVPEYWPVSDPSEICDFVLSAIVPLPRPQEIEAEVE